MWQPCQHCCCLLFSETFPSAVTVCLRVCFVVFQFLSWVLSSALRRFVSNQINHTTLYRIIQHHITSHHITQHSIPPLCITWHCITHPTSHNTTSRNQPFITSSRHFPTKRMTSYHIKSWHVTTPPPPPPTHKRNTSQQHHHTEQVNACAHQNFCLGSALVGGPGGRPCGRAHVPLTAINKFSHVLIHCLVYTPIFTLKLPPPALYP